MVLGVRYLVLVIKAQLNTKLLPLTTYLYPIQCTFFAHFGQRPFIIKLAERIM